MFSWTQLLIKVMVQFCAHSTCHEENTFTGILQRLEESDWLPFITPVTLSSGEVKRWLWEPDSPYWKLPALTAV